MELRRWRAAVPALLVALLATTSPAMADARGDGPDTGDTAAATLPERRIAVTFDDLPWAHFDAASDADLPAHHARLLAALQASGVPAVGFANEGKLYTGATLHPERLAMLEDWLEAGLEIGNHTASHADLHAMGAQAYTRDILTGERHLRSLAARHGRPLRWFRHPFLRTGRDAAEKAAVESFLAEHGYQVAPVTITNADWAWALAYRKALAADDAAGAEKLRRDYIAYQLRMVRYFEQRSTKLFGHEPPQVLLLHANRLNAATWTDLAAALRARGYRFVTLEAALRDPAYASPEALAGPLGTSWIHRWAFASGKSWHFASGEPSTPHWVFAAAGVAPE